MTLNLSDKIETVYKPFITRWLLTTDNTITLPLSSGFNYDFNVDWGDGTTASVSSSSDPNRIHTYSTSGIKTVSILGKMEAWSFNDTGDKLKIIDVIEGGYTGIINMDGGFYGCSNLKTIAGGDWTRKVTNMRRCFRAAGIAISVGVIGDFNSWDVSNVTNMSEMFMQSFFQQPLDNWDVSSVTDMSYMFQQSNRIHLVQDSLKNWDVSNVILFNSMFNAVHVDFSPDFSNWDVSSGQSFYGMFNSGINVNFDVSNWNVSNATSLSYMFDGCTNFNQDISRWDVSNVTSFNNMLNNTGMSQANYDALLIGWDSLELQDSILFGVNGLVYSHPSSASTARQNIIDIDFWIFSGDTSGAPI